MTPVTIITGASAGIGVELARVFARHGHALVLVARREDRLQALAHEIGAGGAATPMVLPIDLAEHGAADRIASALAQRGLEAQYIVNNAGFGLVGPATSLDREEQLDVIEVNVRALTDLTLTFAASVVRHKGGILNVASVGSFLPGPSSAVYYASKAYVLSLTEAMHCELAETGVRVTALCPGPVVTEFQARAGVGLQPSMFDVPAMKVAEEGYEGLMRGRRVVVPGLLNKLLVGALRFAPRSLAMALALRRQRARIARSAHRT
jgi:short-subunit dehydrogenase